MKTFFSQGIACCVVSHNNTTTLPKLFIEYCNTYKVPLLVSNMASSHVSIALYRILNDLFAPIAFMHGVFMEVYDLGILITGRSGMGKSEAALELIEKKHRLIADDTVKFTKVNDHTVIGCSTQVDLHQYNLEIRGLGFLNIQQIYGIGATLDKKKLSLAIELLEWDDEVVNNDRLGKIEEIELLDMKFPFIALHVKAGRNVSLLIETAVRKQKINHYGVSWEGESVFMVEINVKVLNRAGLHARPSSIIVKKASEFSAEIFIGIEGHMVNAKSIMGVMTLGAAYDAELIIRADGDDEQSAVDSIKYLFDNKFADE